MRKKLLYMEDLVKFFQTNNITNFSSNDSGYKLSVQVPATFEVDDNVDDDHRGMLRLKVRVFHIENNRNGSFISEDAARDAMPTIKNRPLLAYIHQRDDGEWDFESHNMSIETDANGDEYVEYQEKQVGSFDESEPFFEYDEELDKTYVCAYAYVSEEYTRACDIIRRKDGTKNSVELSIEELAYNAKDKYLDLQKFYVAASTLLGSRDDGTEVGEGMLGSRADIADFSEHNNSVLSDRDILINDITQAVLSKLDVDRQNSKEGGNAVTMFENLLSKYSKTAEDIDFDYEGMSDEELEQKFAELFDTAEGDPSGEGGDPEDDNGNGEGESESEEDLVEEPDGEANEFSVSGTVEFAGRKLEFSRSFQDTIGALTELVNNTYAEADNDYYDVDVYGDDKYVVMKGWWTGKAYKQTYKVKKDVFTLTSDRVPVYPQYLTEDEMAKLDDMRSNYSKFEEVESKLKKYEEEPQKLEILNSNDYAGIAEMTEFAELKEMKNHFDLTVDELKDKCDKMLLNAAKTGTFNFAKSQNPEKNGISILFGAKAVQKGSFLDELMNMKKN